MLPGRRHDRRKRGVEAHIGRGVEQAHAVRADHAHPVVAHALDELLLQRAPRVADFCEPGGDDDQRLDARGGAVVHDVEDPLARHRDDRQIGAGRQLTRGWITGQTVDFGGAGIDRVDRPLETGGA